MTSWTPKQLDSIRNDFKIAPDRDTDGTPGRLIWVWAAEVDGDIYVRSANPTSRWFASAATFGITSRLPSEEQSSRTITSRSGCVCAKMLPSLSGM